MADGKFVSYLRVSTDKQGLGLEAQREAVDRYLNGGGWELLEEFVEVESGKNDDRPQLQKALHYCRITGATLVIAKLDRLSRDAHFLLGLQKAGVEFVAADMPDANNLTVGVMALVAQQEREAISRRTKEALAAAKARGVKLGNPKGAAVLPKDNSAAVRQIRAKARERAEDLRPILEELEAQGITSYSGKARELERRGIRTPRGGKWYPATVQRVEQQLQKED